MSHFLDFLQAWRRVFTRRASRIAELEKQFERLSTALDVSQLGVFEVDVIAGRLRWSKYHELLFGYAEGEFDGTREGFRSRLHPDDRERMIQVLEAAKKDCEPYRVECRVVWPDGSVHWVHARGQFFRGADGKTVRGIGTVVDVSERRRMEEELRDARATAEAASAAKSEFLTNMSHEIRTPLSAVIGLAEVLQLSASDERVLNLAGRITGNGRHLLALIDAFLDLSKVEAGQVHCEPELVGVGDVVAKVVTMLHSRARAKGLEFETRISERVPEMIRTDPLRLSQILVNVVGNAVKFTRSGTIRIDVQPAGRHLAFRIQDSGIGISPEVAPRLFEPFVQADTSISRAYGGTGLGLYISRKLAHTLGGSLVLASSTIGVGSIFTLEIDPDLGDVASPKSEGSWSIPAPVQVPRASRVLLVEDSPDQRELIAWFLRQGGNVVETAVDGAEAIEKATTKPFDVVLMDLQMPRVDGYEATRRLRALGFKKPILALSAHALDREAERSIAAGCDAHITKPVTHDALLAAIGRFTAPAIGSASPRSRRSLPLEPVQSRLRSENQPSSHP